MSLHLHGLVVPCRGGGAMVARTTCNRRVTSSSLACALLGKTHGRLRNRVTFRHKVDAQASSPSRIKSVQVDEAKKSPGCKQKVNMFMFLHPNHYAVILTIEYDQ